MDEPFSVLAFGSLPSIATGLETASRNREFVVSVASTLDVARYYVDMHAIDCVVCALPFDEDSPNVLSTLRERSRAPIVLLTDQRDRVADIDDDLYDAVHCFETGDADATTDSLADSIRRALQSTRDRQDAHPDGASDGDSSGTPGYDGDTAEDVAAPDTTRAAEHAEVVGRDEPTERDEGAEHDGATERDDGATERDEGAERDEATEHDGEALGSPGPPSSGLEDHSTELQRSNLELEQFAYVAAHDLREPLRMISSYLQLLQRRYGGELDDDADEFIGFAVDGADRMRQMINDLLAYARVDRYEEEFAELDAGETVETALSHLAVAIEESDATVEVGDLPVVVGDRRQLTRLFQNLVSNAIKYAGDDPPAVRIDCAPHDGPDGYCEFTVADDGIGIAPDRQEEVFAIFQSSSDDSTGIGLAICKKIVARHGGEMWVDSTPGEGSTFHFTLPVADDATPAEASEVAQGESAEAR